LSNDERESNEERDLLPLTRRGFLGVSLPVLAAAGLGTFTIGCGGAAIPSRTITAGRAEDIPQGVPQRVEAYDVYLIRNDQGIAAVSGQCPHLGCGVRPASGGFECPCHGSTFASDGTVQRGPANRDLAWFEVRLEGGQVVIDPTHQVPKGTYTPIAPQVG
jgi:nitrite reductase/ring-hydroxylating ferredoxin subunit